MRTRRALLFILLVLTPALAGCNVKDWYNQNGTVRIQLEFPLDGSTINEFRMVNAAVYGVSLRQTDTADPDHFTYPEGDPLVVNLVEKAKTGESVVITEFKTNLRATDRVAVRIAVYEAVTAAGESLEICRLGQAPTKYPCFYQPDNTALQYDKPFAPPRGGLVVVHFPVAVKYAQLQRASEYFLFADPDLVVLENHR